MITISPMPPLGPYPQLLLCPHVGNTPTNAKMRIIRTIVPMLICDPLENGMNYSEKNREAVRLVQQPRRFSRNVRELVRLRELVRRPY
jgi:hypothetical protein